VWVRCKKCNQVFVSESLVRVYEQYKFHLVDEHGYHIQDANFESRTLLKNVED